MIEIGMLRIHRRGNISIRKGIRKTTASEAPRLGGELAAPAETPGRAVRLSVTGPRAQDSGTRSQKTVPCRVFDVGGVEDPGIRGYRVGGGRRYKAEHGNAVCYAGGARRELVSVHELDDEQ